MAFLAHRSTIKTIKRDNVNFMIDDGVVVSPRAGFEINKDCPDAYALVIGDCIRKGWLNPVAYVKDSELMWDLLGEKT